MVCFPGNDLKVAGAFPKYALICDIEGQEYELVTHELDALEKAELIIMEVHPHLIGEEKVKVLLSRLAGLGFKRVDSSGSVVVLRSDAHFSARRCR